MACFVAHVILSNFNENVILDVTVLVFGQKNRRLDNCRTTLLVPCSLIVSNHQLLKEGKRSGPSAVVQCPNEIRTKPLAFCFLAFAAN